MNMDMDIKFLLTLACHPMISIACLSGKETTEKKTPSDQEKPN
jgi:hypothetical protein